MLNVILLGLTSLLTDFSSEMVMPLLPFFIQSVGGGGIAIGLIFGVGDAVAAILKVVSGHWADKTRRYRLFVMAGYLFSSVAKFGYIYALKWPTVAIVRPIERMGKGFRDAPRDAIVSESLPHNQRGKGFGIQRAMDSAGAIIGSVAVLIFFIYFGYSFQRVFLISALVGLASLIPILFVRVPEHLKIQNNKGVSFEKLTTKLKVFIGIATLFALGNFSNAFFILQASQSFTGLSQREGMALALLVYIFFNCFDAGLSGPAGALSDRIGRRKVITVGYLTFSLVCLGFWAVTFIGSTNSIRFGLLVFLFAMYGTFKALIDASQRAFVSDLSGTSIRGTALGTFETATGLAIIPAGLMAGLLWNMSPAYTFLYGFSMAFAAFVVLLAWTKRP